MGTNEAKYRIHMGELKGMIVNEIRRLNSFEQRNYASQAAACRKRIQELKDQLQAVKKELA